MTKAPYREAFVEIESMVGRSPHDAYLQYRSFLDTNALNPSIYLSMAITSGGFARDKELSFGEAMGKNSQFGSQVADQLCRQLPEIEAADIVMPSDLGKVPGWNQADFLEFWAHVITGLDESEAKVISDELAALAVNQLPGFTDSSLPVEEKWLSNLALVEAYVGGLERNQLAQGRDAARLPHNMQAMILILDPEQSVGVNTERYLAHRLGFGEYCLDLNTVDDTYLQADEALHQLGASTLKLSANPDLQLIYGRQNTERAIQLRTDGFRFRKAGLLRGVIFRKLDEARPQLELVLPQTNEAAWREYYAS